MVLGVVAAGFALICIGVFGHQPARAAEIGAPRCARRSGHLPARWSCCRSCLRGRATCPVSPCARRDLALVPARRRRSRRAPWHRLGWPRDSRADQAARARRVAIVGGHDRTCARFLDLLRAQPDPELHLVGVFQAGPAGERPRRPARPRPRRSGRLRRERRIDEVFIALPWHAERRISALVERLGHLPPTPSSVPIGSATPRPW